MSFAERYASRPNQPLCDVGLVVAGLDDDEANGLRDMLAASTKVWPHCGEDSIQEAIEAETGQRLGEKVIRMHRAARCRCARGAE